MVLKLIFFGQVLLINDIINFEASRSRTKDDDRMYVRVSETQKTDDMNHPLICRKV